MKVVFATLVFLYLNLMEIAEAQSQVIYLYSGLNSTGNHVKIEGKYVENLADISFDDQTNSICLTGIWILYEDKSFNPTGQRGVEYYLGRDNYCLNLENLRGKVSSVRFAGFSNDYRIDSLTLYSHTYFQGVEEYITTQAANLYFNEGYGSIIITGNSDWTIFDQKNYQGNWMCLTVSEPGSSSPSFLYDIEKNIHIQPKSIKSVRRGCVRN